MKLELWTPDRQQLKEMTEAWMDRRMGQDWRQILTPQQCAVDVKAMLGWIESGDRCCFLMTAGETPAQKAGTLTEQLYLDAWGTALLDGGRELLRQEIEKTSIENRRYLLKSPGLGHIPLEAMKELYERLEGWRIGIVINDFFVLKPEKSCGGWFSFKEDAETVRCFPGGGCRFCDRREGCEEKQ